jgi:hypothetical protein
LFAVLHPYYKLAYIKLSWGGPEEQAAEFEAGNFDAKDWHDEAKKIVERTVSSLLLNAKYHADLYMKMSQYYNTRPRLPPQMNAINPAENMADAPVLSEFDKLRETLLTADAEEGWASELRRYTSTMQRDVTKHTDLVEWWQVSNSPFVY